MNSSKLGTHPAGAVKPPKREVLHWVRLQNSLATARPFFISRGLWSYGLPEILMCCRPADEPHKLIFCLALQQFERMVTDHHTRGFHARRILQSPEFIKISVDWFSERCYTEEEVAVLHRIAVRKLKTNEEMLLVTQLYEQGQQSGMFNQTQLAGILQHGLALMELADEEDLMPGDTAYNPALASKIIHAVLH